MPCRWWQPIRCISATAGDSEGVLFGDRGLERHILVMATLKKKKAPSAGGWVLLLVMTCARLMGLGLFSRYQRWQWCLWWDLDWRFCAGSFTEVGVTPLSLE